MKNETFFTVLLIFLFFACQKTNTPREFEYRTIVPNEIYQNDKRNLEKLFQENVTSDTSILVVSENLIYLESYVDTLFYGPNGKMAFLGINKIINKNLDLFPEKYPDMVEYIGTGIMVIKHNEETYEFINDINFRATGGRTYEDASKFIRKILFNEPMLDPHRIRYNINDIRFWDSNDWVYPDGSPVVLNNSD